MARYEQPSLAECQSIADVLTQSYKSSKGENPKRLSFIKLLDRAVKITGIDEPQVRALVTGAAAFELETIEAEYPRSSPLRQKGWIYNSGSRLYTDLLDKMKINEKNPLNDDERLIHLLKFYHFIEKEFSDNDIKELGWVSKQKLLDDVKDKMKTVKNREFKKIKALINSSPTLEAVKKKTDKIFPDYQAEASSRFWKNTKRLDSTLFIEFINKTSERIYKQNDYYDDKDSDELKNRNYIQWKNILSGSSLFAALEIDPEYRLFSPNRSFHYRQCAGTINLKSLQDSQTRIIYLRALSAHLTDLKSFKQYDELIREWKQKGLKDVDKLQSKIENFIKEEEKEHPSRIKEWFSGGVNYVAQYGIGFALTKYSFDAAILTVPAIGSLAATAAMGPIGLVVYGLAGTIITTQLGLLVKNKLVPGAVAAIYSKMLEKVGESVGNATTNVVVGTFSVTANGIKSFIGYSKENEKDNFMEEWIDTLLTLPDDIMSVQEKKEIRDLLGLEADATLSMQRESRNSLVPR